MRYLFRHSHKMENSTRDYVFPLAIEIVSLLVLFAIGSCIVSAIMPESPVVHASRVLGVGVPKQSAVISDKYEEPSFPLGDGYSWIVLQIPDEELHDFTKAIATSPDWEPLPLSPALAQDEHCLQPDLIEGKIAIASATGSYMFIDRQEEYNKEHYGRDSYETEKPLCERASQNFLFSLFNERDGRLYIWSIDT